MFGIGITHLTSLLARRSVYCSKHANGEHSIAKGFTSDDGQHLVRAHGAHVGGRQVQVLRRKPEDVFDRGEGLETHAYAFIHTDDIKTRLAEMFGGDMQFDVIIGNPPYQMTAAAGGTSDSPIYQLFVEQAMKLEPRFLTMVIPSRWMAGGRGLDEFREPNAHSDRRMRDLDGLSERDGRVSRRRDQGRRLLLPLGPRQSGHCDVTTHSGWRRTSSSQSRALWASSMSSSVMSER